MKPAFWARRVHKWVGLVVGVQALVWMISGVYMTVVSLDVIHGDHLAHASTDTLNASTDWMAPDALSSRYPGMTRYRVKQLLGRDVFEVHQGKRVALVDAVTGKQISPLEKTAVRALAVSLYQGDAQVRDVAWITKAPQEVATRPVPLWAVRFADSGDTTLYFSPHTGELLARRHSLWRWFDFVWMFHIMDYESRTDVNNNLLRVAAGIGLVFALSGIWLLLYSFRRSTTA